MSRNMTSTQIIEDGQYLDPDFDPSTLTVAQLLGVLGYHNVSYPTPYNKSKLVQVFNESIKSKHKKLQKERLARNNTDPSDDGITDGITGEPIGGKREPQPRRSTRLSRASTAEVQEPPELPKKRRSSAQPSLGGSPRKYTAKRQAAPTVVEESESEKEEVEVPARKAIKKKETDAPGARLRRLSGPDSGWEDNNIFQSGSPSPAQPTPRRKSTRGRKSTSAPPESPFVGVASSTISPPKATKFEPKLPATLVEEFRRASPSPFKKASLPKDGFADEDNPFKATPSKASSQYYDYQVPLKGEDEDDGFFADADVSGMDDSFAQLDSVAKAVEEEETDEDKEEDESVAISRRIARGDSSALVRRPPPAQLSAPLPIYVRTILIAFISLTGYLASIWKTESAQLGFCDPGSTTNAAVEKWKADLSAIEACNRENRTTLYLPSTDNDKDLIPCPAEPIIAYHPMSCTPCPAHATCDLYSVVCDNGYLLHPHPLLFWTNPLSSRENISLSASSSPSTFFATLFSYLDGLPGLGSVAFPPHCVEDPKRKRNIGALGKAIETYLAQERGRKLCTGQTVPASESDGGEAKTWGIAVEELRVVMQQKTPSHLLATFDDTFSEAVQQLIHWGGVVIGEDATGRRYLARTIPDLTWTCALTVKSRETWAEWRATLAGFVTLALGLYYSRYRLAKRRATAKQVAELVQVALDALRNQEIAHHTDPVTAPYAYLSSLQLRDLILQEEHSIPKRRKLWERVEKVVEGNANVRVNLQEVEGGDELRVWRWVGSARRAPRASYADREHELETPSKKVGKN